MTIACGLTSLLTPVVILLIAIAFDVSFMFAFPPQDSIINLLQNSEDYSQTVWFEKLFRQIILAFDLSTASLALRGVLKRNRYLLVPFLCWNVILTAVAGYFIYLKSRQEPDFLSRAINIVSAPVPWPKYGSYELSLMDMVMLVPIVAFKGFMMVRLCLHFRSLTSVRPKQSPEHDLNDLKVVLQKQIHETINRHISRSHPRY